MTNEATTAVRNWTWDDHGSVLWIIENPNVYAVEYLVEVLGNENGAIQFEGQNYTNGDYLLSTEFLTAADLAATEIDHHISTITVDPAEAKVTVKYVGDETTDINNAPTTTAPRVIYDLSGRRTLHPTKGVYIVNGKKIVF